MDSNNFTNQPGAQPINNVPNQMDGMPMGQPYPQQPMNGGMPMGQPYPQQPMNGGMPMGQPYPQQPMMKSPKKPMDPAKKKKIILIVSILSGVAVVGIALAIILPIVLRVDYTSAYEIASKMYNDSTVYDIYLNYRDGCDDVSFYVDNSWTSSSSYDGLIDRCKKVYSGDVISQINELGETAGVQRNEEIKAAFDTFKTEYSKLIPDNTETLEQNLDAWKAWHSFIVDRPGIYSSVTDSEITAAANHLINSSNSDLKTYGETWLEKRLDLGNTYRKYLNDGSVSYSEYSRKRSEFEDWVSSNEPSIETIAPIEFSSNSAAYSVYEKFDELYRKIKDAYNESTGNTKCYTMPDGSKYCDDLGIFD